MMVRTVVGVLIAYLLGSINFSIIISKIFLGDDIRKHGSGNAGATNSIRIMGKKLGVLVSVGDILKGVFAIVLARMIADERAAWLAAFACILGHIFPLYFGFKGGKGVLPGVAVVMTLDWRVGLICLSFFILATLFTRLVSLGSVLGSVAAPVFVWIFKRSVFETVVVLLIVALIIAKHSGNIQRMLLGTEPKIGEKKMKKEAGS